MIELKRDTVDILGTTYRIEIHNYEEDGEFRRLRCAAYCDSNDHLIVVTDVESMPGAKFSTPKAKENYHRHIFRHEIIHAFMKESGLSASSMPITDEGWAENDEIIDWFAIQGPKIMKLWVELGIAEVIA